MCNVNTGRATAIHNTISAKHRRDTTMVYTNNNNNNIRPESPCQVALLFSIVFIFLLCHSIRLGLNIYEAFQVSHIKLLAS